jgi:indole-3-acetate O-methyltransferase
MHKLVGLVREHEPDTHISLVYEDQASNDWTSVFRRLQGDISAAGEQSIIERFPNLSISATGVSFYQPCFPPASIDLMFSATAMHWLRAAPCEMPDALHSATLPADSPAAAAYARAADADWRLILRERARELKPGGRFGCVTFARDEPGLRFLGASPHVPRSMHACFRDIWAALVADGAISPAEFRATNFPNQYRTLAECLAPFGGPAGPAAAAAARIVGAGDGGVRAAARFEGLAVIGAGYGEVRCPYHRRWLAERPPPDAPAAALADAARVHARAYVPTTRTWSNSSFEAGLSRARPAAERAGVVDEMFRRYEDAVAAAPEDHAMDYFHVYMAVEKEVGSRQ